MKYSVIIPVYNAEKTLRRCLDSLAAQSFSDAEFLLIDDGSADSSAAICREYAARDSRFRLIPKENGGVSTARNLGLEMARGTFILFVDSDDHVQPDYLRRLEELDGEGRYDYLLFSYNRFNDDRVNELVLPEFASCTEAEYTSALGWAYRTKHINAPWNKRYRSSILREHGLRFHTALPIAEDTLFNLNYLLHIRSYRTCGAKLYNVSLENPDSLSRKPLANRRELLAIFDREAAQTIAAAPISEALRDTLIRSRHFLLLSDIYSEAKQLHLAHTGLPDRWRRLYSLCRDFFRSSPKLPGDLRSRLLILPVRLRLIPVIDLLGKKLSK